jgi:hypothetical protein
MAYAFFLMTSDHYDDMALVYALYVIAGLSQRHAIGVARWLGKLSQVGVEFCVQLLQPDGQFCQL